MEVAVDLDPQVFFYKDLNGLKRRLEDYGTAVLTIEGSYYLHSHRDPSQVNVNHRHFLIDLLFTLYLNRQDLASPAYETVFE